MLKRYQRTFVLTMVHTVHTPLSEQFVELKNLKTQTEFNGTCTVGYRTLEHTYSVGR